MKKIIFVATALFVGGVAYGQTFDMNCHNPDIKNLKVTLQGTNSSGLGQASSELVQYNINLPGSRGAIFVDKKNNGVCRIKISSGYRMLNGHGKIDPTNISSGDEFTSVIRAVIPPICLKQTVDTLICQVQLARQDLSGTINVNWLFEYEKAN